MLYLVQEANSSKQKGTHSKLSMNTTEIFLFPWFRKYKRKGLCFTSLNPYYWIKETRYHSITMLCIKMKTCKEWSSSNVKESETRANKIIKQILEVEQTKNTEYFDLRQWTPLVKLPCSSSFSKYCKSRKREQLNLSACKNKLNWSSKMTGN